MFSNKKNDFSNNFRFEIKKELIKAVFGVLLFMDQKHGPEEKNRKEVCKAFETWCWRGMLKIKWTDRIW